MNKLFLFVISVFLLLSAAMWHLAELSFTEHLKIQIENVGLSATGYQITTETINASSAQNHGYIEKLSITAENKTLISIDRIDYQFDIKSLKKDIIIIENISITNINKINLSAEQQTNIINNLNHFLTNKNNTEKTAQQLPVMTLKQLVLIESDTKEEIPLNLAILETGFEADSLFIHILKIIFHQKMV